MLATPLLSALLVFAAPAPPETPAPLKLTRDEENALEELAKVGVEVFKERYNVYPEGSVLVYHPGTGDRPGAKELAPLARLPRLRKLDLGDAYADDDTLAAIAGMTGLEQLYLYRTRLTDDGLKSLKGLKRLRVLDLRGTGVTNKGLKIIAEQPALSI